MKLCVEKNPNGIPICFLAALLITLVPSYAVAQDSATEWGGWHLQSLDGMVRQENFYKEEKTERANQPTENQTSREVRGTVELDTRSYVLHPNFLLLDVGGEYTPGLQKNDSLVIPDRTETQTGERASARTTFFSDRPFSVTNFGSYTHNFTNREFLTSVESYRNNAGTSARWNNGIAPLSLGYTYDDWKQTEQETGRKFENRTNTLRGELTKSFSDRDEHELTYSYDDFFREFAGATVENKTHNTNLRERFFFDASRKDLLTSDISYYDQTGSQDLRRTEVNENIKFVLPRHLGTTATYQLARIDRDEFQSTKNFGSAALYHDLYQSLRSTLFTEYSDFQQTGVNESYGKGGVSFNYQKKIPTGSMTLFYESSYRADEKRADTARRRVVGEARTILDQEIILLSNPGAIPETVVVHDFTGTTIYEQALDYIIVPRGLFLEIQRIIGGQIPNGQTVFIDYDTDFLVDYQLGAIENRFGSQFSLFHNLLQLYFRGNEFDYTKEEGTGIAALKVTSQQIYGATVNWGPLSLGAERDDFDSNIVPYQSTRYFADVNHLFAEVLLLAFNTSYRNLYLTDDHQHQNFTDLGGRIAYFISPHLKLNLSETSRLQDGKGIDLTLHTAKLELVAQLRLLTFTVGAQTYYRDYLEENKKFLELFSKIERRF